MTATAAPPERVAPARRPALRIPWEPWAVLVVALAAWEVLSRQEIISPRLFASPTRIVAAWQGLAARDQIWTHLSATLQALAVAFVLFTVAGAVLGAVLGASRARFEVFYGPIGALFALPKVTLAPIFVLLFGLGLEQKILFGAMFGLFPLLMNTMVGVRDIRRSHLDLFDALGASRWLRFRALMLPGALPAFATGLRVGYVYAGVGVLLAEMYVAQRGLGNRVIGAALQSTLDDFWVYVVLATLVLLTGAGLLALLERRLARWKDGQDHG